jgi:hypothetical protein
VSRTIRFGAILSVIALSIVYLFGILSPAPAQDKTAVGPAVSKVAGGAPVPVKATKWEYKVITMHPNDEAEASEGLNKLAGEGFRLVSTTSVSTSQGQGASTNMTTRFVLERERP